MPGQKRKIEEQNSPDEHSGFTPILQSFFSTVSPPEQIAVEEPRNRQVQDSTDKDQGIDVFQELATMLGVEPVDNTSTPPKSSNNNANDQKQEVRNINAVPDKLEDVLGLAPRTQSNEENVKAIYDFFKQVKADAMLGTNLFLIQLIGTIKTLETSLEYNIFQSKDRNQVKKALIKNYEQLNNELYNCLDQTTSTDSWNIQYGLVQAISIRLPRLAANEPIPPVNPAQLCSNINISTTLSSNSQDLPKPPEVLNPLEEETALHKDMNALMVAKTKENFEKIIFANKNVLRWLRGERLDYLSVQFPVIEGYSWQVNLFANALNLRINSKILLDWVFENHHLINLLICPEQNKTQGMFLFNALYSFITSFVNKDLQINDVQFLQYLTDVIPEDSLMREVRKYLERSKTTAIYEPCLIRIDNILSVFSSKKPKNSVFFNSSTNTNIANNEFLSLDNFQWLLLKNTEQRLLKVTHKEHFEKEWKSNPHIVHWMRNTLVKLSESDLRKIQASVCLVIFQKMLKLKVDSSIVQALLTHDSEVIGLLSKNSALETQIVDYIYQQAWDESAKNFAKALIGSISDCTMLDIMLRHCNNLASAYIPPEKIPAVTTIKDLIEQQKIKLNAPSQIKSNFP